MIESIAQLVESAAAYPSLFDRIMVYEMELHDVTAQVLIGRMHRQLDTMRQAVDKGIFGVESATGLSGGDAVKMARYLESERWLSGSLILSAVRNAIATNEVNAAMGIICATPTAGSAGVVPGVLFALAEAQTMTLEQQIRFLFVAGAFGLVVANNASISGASGGCQAEIGSASAMASAAVVDYMGGSAQMCSEAFAMTLKNMLGLVCDPVAGLVEVPCVKRNALGASQAMISADMALAGIRSTIPADDVVAAMKRIGDEMHPKYKETGEGGLAETATGLAHQRRIFGS